MISGSVFLEILIVVVSTGVMIFWMRVAWRAMLAHERLAGAAESAASLWQKVDRIGNAEVRRAHVDGSPSEVEAGAAEMLLGKEERIK